VGALLGVVNLVSIREISKTTNKLQELIDEAF